VTKGNAALLVAASKLNRLDWAAQMVGMDNRMAARTVRAWECNREVRQMAQRLEPQIRRCL
jgi:hypothetical protein